MSGEYPGGYPEIVDWDAYSASLLPDVAANGQGADFFRLLVEPLRVLDDRVSTLYAGIVEIEDASGPTLDLLGDYAGEPRQGLSDRLYRRIIAGRRVARSGGVTRPKVYAGWAALTGSSSARMEELGSASVRLSAAVDFTPSGVWLGRAASVVRDLIGTGYQATASVITPVSARYADPTTPWGVGLWAYEIPVSGAS